MRTGRSPAGRGADRADPRRHQRLGPRPLPARTHRGRRRRRLPRDALHRRGRRTDEISTYEDLLAAYDLDAFVLTAPHHGDPRTAWLTERGVPFVTFGRPWDAPHDRSWVDVDGAAGTGQVTRRLLEAGHRRIAFIGWPPGSGVGDDRRAGWSRELVACGHGSRPRRPYPGRGRPGRGVRAPSCWPSTPRRPRSSAPATRSRSARCARSATTAPPSSASTTPRWRRPSGSPASASRCPKPRRAAWECSPTSWTATRPARTGAGAPGAVARGPHDRLTRLDPPSHTTGVRHETHPIPRRRRRGARRRHVARLRGLRRQRLRRRRRAAPSSSGGQAALQILIGSSGDAETKAVKDAAAAWATASGNTATVTPGPGHRASSSARRFAGGTPPDVFYVDAGRFADYASVGALEPYGDKIANPDDFYESLRTTFTYDGKLYCAPKDFSTLALQINTDLWAKAGLTDADVPTTWDQLTAVVPEAQGGEGPAAGHRRHPRPDRRVHGAGRRLDRQRGRQAGHRRHRRRTSQALEYVQGLLKQGYAAYPKQRRRRLGRRGVRQGQGRHDDRGQLDQGRDAERLPGREVHRAPAAGRPGGQGHALVHPVLGHRRQEQVKDAGDRRSSRR